MKSRRKNLSRCRVPTLTDEPRVGAQARLEIVPGALGQGLGGGLAVGVEIGQPGSGEQEKRGKKTGFQRWSSSATSKNFKRN